MAPNAIVEKRTHRDALVITTTAESSLLHGDILSITYDEQQYPITPQNVLEFFHLLKILIETGQKEFKNATIGIDPGFKHTGIAVFINGIIIEAVSLQSNDVDITKQVQTILNHVNINQAKDSPCHIVIKVGNGNFVEMQKVINLLLNHEMPMAFELQIVDEKCSNTDFVIQDSSFIKLSGKHARAAINIALRDGTRVDEGVDLKEGNGMRREGFSRKYVRMVQDESRKITIHDDSVAGGISIDETLATKVLLGKLTLMEAINKQKEGQKRNGSTSTNRETT